jgi:hypothetical protein
LVHSLENENIPSEKSANNEIEGQKSVQLASVMSPLEVSPHEVFYHKHFIHFDTGQKYFPLIKMFVAPNI